MRHILQGQYPDYAGKIQFYVGDVRNVDSVRDVMHGANYVFHAVVLKEVLLVTRADLCVTISNTQSSSDVSNNVTCFALFAIFLCFGIY